jgi:predicted nicotinamide N-methyase
MKLLSMLALGATRGNVPACEKLEAEKLSLLELQIDQTFVRVLDAEFLIRTCLESRGIDWDALAPKRQPRLGKLGKVVGMRKDAARVQFGDGALMWWTSEFLRLPKHDALNQFQVLAGAQQLPDPTPIQPNSLRSGGMWWKPEWMRRRESAEQLAGGGAGRHRHRAGLPIMTEAEAVEANCDAVGGVPAESEHVHTVERPDLEGWTGGVIWEASEILARMLELRPEYVRGKTVLELGAGCGLCGLIAVSVGAAHTVLTDKVTFMLNHNVQRFREDTDYMHGRSQIEIKKLEWGNDRDIEAVATDPPVQVILGSDLVYFVEHLPTLAATVIQLSGENTLVLWLTPDGPSEGLIGAADPHARTQREQARRASVDVLRSPSQILTTDEYTSYSRTAIDTFWDKMVEHFTIVEISRHRWVSDILDSMPLTENAADRRGPLRVFEMLYRGQSERET